MSDKVLRHVIAFLGTLCFAFTYWAAYMAGAAGWWWTAIGLIFIYLIVYKLVDA